MTSPFLSALLSSNPSAANGLLGGLDSSSTGTADNIAILRSLILLRQQQAEQEETQASLLQQQIAALAGLSQAQAQLKHTENAIALTLFRQQQQNQVLEQLQNSLASAPSSAAALPSASHSGGVPTTPTIDQATAMAIAGLTNLANPTRDDSTTFPSLFQEEESANNVASDDALSLMSDPKRKGRAGTFPQKLHHMLNDTEARGLSHLASFLPHGRAFIIHKPRDFAAQVMPDYFGKMSRFSSFQRQLNLYDFIRITEGTDKGAYYHDLFIRNRPDMCILMKRSKIKGVVFNHKNEHRDDNKLNAGKEAAATTNLVSLEDSESENGISSDGAKCSP